MFTYEWVIMIALLALCCIRARCAFILFLSISIYVAFISGVESDSRYYLLVILKDFVTGLLLELRNNNAALCSYALSVTGLFGFAMWYFMFEPIVFDVVYAVVAVLQIALILPKGAANGRDRSHEGFGFNISDYFIYNQSRDKMFKSKG